MGETNAMVAEALGLFREGRLAEALPLLEALLAAGDTPLPCILALADAREASGNDPGAIRLLAAVHEALPRPDFAVALAAAMQRAGDREGLDGLLPRLQASHPGDHRLGAIAAEHLLKRGDFAAGFDLLPHRWAISAVARQTDGLRCPEWDGRPFPGTLLLGTEQGIGETVLHASMFGDLLTMGQRTLVACEARLLPLFRRSFPGLQFEDAASRPLARYAGNFGNRRFEAGDLGRLFRRAAGDFPVRRQWLAADPARTGELRRDLQSRFPGKRLVGLAWYSHRKLRGDSKNVPVEALAPVFSPADTVVVNLQYGDVSADLRDMADRGMHLVTVPGIDLTHDIEATCALAAAMDCVVSSSNSLAHLAAALGIDTRILLPGARYVLWYWGYEGDITPWYPAAHLFRGPPRSTWASAVTAAAGMLIQAPVAHACAPAAPL